MNCGKPPASASKGLNVKKVRMSPSASSNNKGRRKPFSLIVVNLTAQQKLTRTYLPLLVLASKEPAELVLRLERLWRTTPNTTPCRPMRPSEELSPLGSPPSPFILLLAWSLLSSFNSTQHYLEGVATVLYSIRLPTPLGCEGRNVGTTLLSSSFPIWEDWAHLCSFADLQVPFCWVLQPGS